MIESISMDYKKEMLKILDELKKRNHTRRKIEKFFGYAEKSIDQLLAKGGNQIVLNKLKEYKKQVDEGHISSLNGEMAAYIKRTPERNSDRALINMLIEEVALLKSKALGISFEDALAELEKNARIALKQIEDRL